MKKIFALLLAFLIFIPNIHVAMAKNVELTQTVVDANIHEDGTVTITETWTVDFDGDFTQFERRIPVNPNETLQMNSVVVNGFESEQLNYIDDDRPNGYYAYQDFGDEVVLNIYMRADDERMDFTISYTIDGAIHRYEDVAEFNFNMIGDEWELPMNHVSGTITFPMVENMNDDIHVWGHGPTHGRVEIESSQSVYYECMNLSENRALNIRLLLPSDMFSSLEKDNHAYLEEIIEEEAGLAKAEANKQKFKEIGAYVGGSVSFVLSVGCVLLVFIKRRKLLNQYQPSFEPEYCRELPSDLSPSEVIDLLNYKNKKYKDENKFASTLMSLSLKGLLSFEMYEEDGLFKTKKKTKILIHHDGTKAEALKYHEYVLYKFIKECSFDDEVTIDDIERIVDKRPKASQRTLERFRTGSLGLVEKAGYFDLRVKSGWMSLVGSLLLFVSLGVLVLIVGTADTFDLTLFILSILPAFAGLACLVMGFTCKRYTQKGVDEVVLWKAFERFLKEFTLMDEKELPELIVWEEYLVYAVALGIGEKVLKQLPEVYPNFYESDFYQHSYVRCFYYHGHLNLDVFDGIQSFSNNLDTAMHYRENSTGSGGSFSSGGGGFAGGGGSSGGGGGSFS